MVDVKSLREALIKLLEEEEQSDPDWGFISEISDRTLAEIIESGYTNIVDERVFHYLEDYDVRQQSLTAARKQRERLKILLELDKVKA